MRSPPILQFQMLFTHRHQSSQPPPYVYLSDGGLIECLGVMALLRRRMKLIICSDACEDAEYTLRALRDTIALAREERLCSFFDPERPGRDVALTMAELRHSDAPFLRLGILYEPVEGDGSKSEQLIGYIYYVRMRLAPGDTAATRDLLTERELLDPPRIPDGSGFVTELPELLQAQDDGMSLHYMETSGPAVEPVEGAIRPRRTLNGLCCREGGCFLATLCARVFGRVSGRRFPNFSTGNQCIQPIHFANLCALGAEMSWPLVTHIASTAE